MRLLLDSNIWRYLIDADAIPVVQHAVRVSRHTIAVAPATLYEAAHTKDRVLRDRLLAAMKRTCWKRLMPEAYWLAEEVKGEVQRLRPEWLRPRPDLSRVTRVRHDWIRARGGVWDRIIDEAELLQRQQASMLDQAREQAYRLRDDAKTWSSPKWESAALTKTLGSLAKPTAGWDGQPFEAWRFDGMNVFTTAMNTPGNPAIDWLEGEVDLQLMTFQSASLRKFWLHDVDLIRMPRHWLLWAFEFLQRLRRVTDGTPGDAQLGTYLVDVDLMLSADKTLVWIAERCRRDAPFKVAESALIAGGGDIAEEVLRRLRSH